MPQIEALSTTASHATPGWTYVPDTGIDPAKAATKPAAGRKRGINREAGGRADLTSRQTTAIVRHLAKLDRENHKDVHIPVPVKHKDAAGRGAYWLLHYHNIPLIGAAY
jgi:zinc finger HIT domain-containing protein 1